MTDGPDNLILVYLRRMDQKLDHLTSTVDDHSRRLTSLEHGVAGLRKDFAGQSERLDRIDIRLDRM